MRTCYYMCQYDSMAIPLERCQNLGLDHVLVFPSWHFSLTTLVYHCGNHIFVRSVLNLLRVSESSFIKRKLTLIKIVCLTVDQNGFVK